MPRSHAAPLRARTEMVESDPSRPAPVGGLRRLRPRRWGPVSRRGRWRRFVALRVLSALLLGLAVWLAVSALLPVPADPGSPVVVLPASLPVGATLRAGDVRVERRPPAELPEGAVTSAAAAVGQVLSGPVTAGEVLTSARFQGPDQLRGLQTGSLAVGVPVSDSALSGALRPGDTVSVLVGGTGQVVAPAAVVLAVRQEDRGGLTGAGSAARVLVAVSPDEAHGIATAAGPSGAAAPLLVALRR